MPQSSRARRAVTSRVQLYPRVQGKLNLATSECRKLQDAALHTLLLHFCRMPKNIEVSENAWTIAEVAVIYAAFVGVILIYATVQFCREEQQLERKKRKQR